MKKAPSTELWASEAPRAPARGICGEAKRNCAEATRLRPAGCAAVACRHFIGPKPLAKADPPRAATRGILAKASERGRHEKDPFLLVGHDWDVCLVKIRAFEKERLTGVFRQGVSTTVPNIEACGVPSFPIGSPC